jgi:hypothetical protein
MARMARGAFWAVVLWCVAPTRGGTLSEGDLVRLSAQVGHKQNTGDGAARSFKYLRYGDIERELLRLEREYPGLVEVYDAQSRYKLPSPGDCGTSGPCKQYVLRITNEATLSSDSERPEVFLSGELHGNERVGPTTVMELARLLVESHAARSNAWLHRLVDTRSIVIMPTANALGYFADTREEGSVDPNRDFPIDAPGRCMESVAARAVNEVWREHLFQLSLTYHGGMQSIAFEWGTVSNLHSDVSPDDTAQLVLGSAMSAFAGAFSDEGRYPHGRLNDQVYPVRGGMEDWGYAGSWSDKVAPCDPSSFGGYPAQRTKYGDAELRAFNILIETSKYKEPSEGALGSSAALLSRGGSAGDGHVPRNVRLALIVIDMVQPYLQWVAYDKQRLEFSWEVGGASYVDETHLSYKVRAADGSVATKTTPPLSGPTRWTGSAKTNSNRPANQDALDGKDIELEHADDQDDRQLWPFLPAFTQQIVLPQGAQLLAVTAVASVDKAWATQPRAPSPRLPPQSHVVNARTNPAWDKTNNGHRVRGRMQWLSDQIDMLKQDDAEAQQAQAQDNDHDHDHDHDHAHDEREERAHAPQQAEAGHSHSHSDAEPEVSNTQAAALVALAIFGPACCFCCLWSSRFSSSAAKAREPAYMPV